MERCYSRVSSIIKESDFSKNGDDTLESEIAQASDIYFDQKRIDYDLRHDARCKDDDLQDLSSENIFNYSALVPAS